MKRYWTLTRVLILAICLGMGCSSIVASGEIVEVPSGNNSVHGSEVLKVHFIDMGQADVLEIGHHGSSNSTTPEYLAKVNPKYAVIMVGKGNDYGHPHKETIELLIGKGIDIYRTDEQGTIAAESDGKNIRFNVNPGGNTYGSENSSAIKPYMDSAGNGLIKGNINSKGEKIYHLPGGAYYDNTIPEKWFKTEHEAQEAGYRPSGR